jgi:hypothetical protein
VGKEYSQGTYHLLSDMLKILTKFGPIFETELKGMGERSVSEFKGVRFTVLIPLGCYLGSPLAA